MVIMNGSKIDSTTAELGATVLRVSLGLMYLAHAVLLKVYMFGLPGVAGWFEEALGLPSFLAYVVFALEVTGGVLLVLGIYSRLVALALIPILIGTITHVHGVNGWVFSNEGGGWEYPAFLIVASVAIALIGDGRFALRRTVLSFGK